MLSSPLFSIRGLLLASNFRLPVCNSNRCSSRCTGTVLGSSYFTIGNQEDKNKEHVLKGTVLPDIVFYFRVYKLKSVTLVRPLMVFKFVHFVVL